MRRLWDILYKNKMNSQKIATNGESERVNRFFTKSEHDKRHIIYLMYTPDGT